jgi:hypothetical protein
MKRDFRYRQGSREDGARLSRFLRQTEIFQRRAGESATDIGFDDQFEQSNVRKLYSIFFRFTCRFGWAEIPLLANNFPE